MKNYMLYIKSLDYYRLTLKINWILKITLPLILIAYKVYYLYKCSIFLLIMQIHTNKQAWQLCKNSGFKFVVGELHFALLFLYQYCQMFVYTSYLHHSYLFASLVFIYIQISYKTDKNYKQIITPICDFILTQLCHIVENVWWL